MLRDIFCDAAEEELREALAGMCPHDDEVCLFGFHGLAEAFLYGDVIVDFQLPSWVTYLAAQPLDKALDGRRVIKDIRRIDDGEDDPNVRPWL